MTQKLLNIMSASLCSCLSYAAVKLHIFCATLWRHV